MQENKTVRQIHRWCSVAFTITVIIDFVAIMLGYYQDESALWVFYLPLPPLAVQLFTGLYLFVLPYLGRRRTPRRADTV